MDYKEKYEMSLEGIQEILSSGEDSIKMSRLQLRLQGIFPELKEPEDERISKALIHLVNSNKELSFGIDNYDGIKWSDILAWLEKKGNEPNWCHHKVDLSNCSEEYRKAYYDGWNNCNMQHSQCKSELDDVLKCLINGMKFYYEDNKDATWGTDKWSMPVKHIIEVLEKQCEQKSYASETMNEKGGFTRMMEKEQKPAVEMKTPEESLGIDSETYNEIVDECIYGKQEPTVEPKFKVGYYIERKDGLGCHAKIIYIGKNVYGCEKLIYPKDSSPFFELMFENQDEFKISSDFQQNHALSEEDENIISFLINITEDYRIRNGFSSVLEQGNKAIDWLKSLRSLNKCTYNPYKEVVESITEMCKHYDRMDLGSLQDFYDNVKVKCNQL